MVVASWLSPDSLCLYPVLNFLVSADFVMSGLAPCRTIGRYMLPLLAGLMPPRKTLRPTPDVRLPPLQAVKLLDQLRERIRCLHCSRRTKESHSYRVRLFIR